jgi:iron complex outermembrane receptor protein
MNARVQCAVQMILGAVLVSAAIPAQATPAGAAGAAAAANANSAAAADAELAAAATGNVALKLVTIEGYHDFTSQVLTPKQLRNSSQPAEAVTKTMIDMFGPDAGGIQALSVLPNVYVSGTNNYSATGRQTISIRGIKVGYNSIPGDVETNAVQAEFDGVPLNSLSQGTAWHSVEIPIGALMQGENVIIGPGNPSERWYSSMGGTIDFIPVQPSARAGGKVTLAGGSSSTYDTSAIYNTGEVHGWSTVFGLASARSDAIRTTQDSLPADNEEGYVKTRKQLTSGSVSFGYYFQRNHEWRPNMIPLTPQPLLDTGGLGIGQPYSQQTAGFYSTLPRSVWHKTIEIQNHMLWSHLHLNLSRTLHLSNIVWIRLGKVVHYRSNNFILPSNPLFAQYGGAVQSSLPSNPLLNYSGATNVEHYIEHSKTFGDRLAFTQDFGSIDTLEYGGYMIFSIRTSTVARSHSLSRHTTTPRITSTGRGSCRMISGPFRA